MLHGYKGHLKTITMTKDKTKKVKDKINFHQGLYKMGLRKKIQSFTGLCEFFRCLTRKELRFRNKHTLRGNTRAIKKINLLRREKYNNEKKHYRSKGAA